MEFNLLGIVSLVFLITAVGSVINHKYLKYPSTIGVLVISTVFSLTLVALQYQEIIQVNGVAQIVEKVHFETLLINWMLPVLLFAGALHVPVNDLKKYKFQIFTLATVGVILSSFVLSTILYYSAPFFEVSLSFIQCMVFGVLISSTDPICVLGLLSRGNVSHSLKAKITGESLFNDGTSVVLFITLVNVAFKTGGVPELDYVQMAYSLFTEICGGIVIGLITAYLASHLIKMVDAYDIHIIITMALVYGTYALCNYLHFSGPIGVVISGLYIGNRTIKKFMSQKSKEHVDTFWGMTDNILNAILFVLMGLVLVLFQFSGKTLLFGVVAIVGMLIARYTSILGSALLLIPLKPDFKKMPILMTWAGLRGGISIALALSIPNSHPEVKQIILIMTFMCVFFSVLVQGMSLNKVIEKINNRGGIDDQESADPEEE